MVGEYNEEVILFIKLRKIIYVRKNTFKYALIAHLEVTCFESQSRPS